MQGIGALITNVTTQAQQFILPALVIFGIAIAGYALMIGDSRTARAWGVGTLIGAAIVLSAQAIAGLVQGAAHG